MSTFWNQFNKEKWLLTLCFVLAFFAWQGIRRNMSFPLPISDVPVEISVPEGWAVLEKSVESVDIRLLGSRDDIRDLKRDPLRVVIPVPDPQREKPMTITLQPQYLKNNPTDAKAARFNPQEIEIILDRQEEKLLPVKAELNGALPEGVEIEQIIYTPSVVRVTGAQQQLDKMENIQTEPIELKNRQASFKENVRIALPQDGRLKVEPDRVSVEFVLVTRSSTATFEKIPVQVLSNPGEHRRIDVVPVSIEVGVRGLQQRIEQLRAGDLLAYVDCTDLVEATRYELPVVVELPAGIQAVKTEPAAVRVEIINLN